LKPDGGLTVNASTARSPTDCAPILPSSWPGSATAGVRGSARWAKMLDGGVPASSLTRPMTVSVRVAATRPESTSAVRSGCSRLPGISSVSTLPSAPTRAA